MRSSLLLNISPPVGVLGFGLDFVKEGGGDEWLLGVPNKVGGGELLLDENMTLLFSVPYQSESFHSFSSTSVLRPTHKLVRRNHLLYSVCFLFG